MSRFDDELPFPAVPLATRKLTQQAEEIAMITAEETAFMHSILCQCGLPRSKVAGDRFERKAGSASLLIESGDIADGRGGWIKAPVPYGAKPRLTLIQLCTQAVKTQSPIIDVGDSMAGFLRSIGIDYAASPRVLRETKKQLMALAVCRMTLAYWDGQKVTQTKGDPIQAFNAWLPTDPAQGTLWADEIKLGREFFENLCEHAVPLDPRAIHALRGSALALDEYTWLANRLHRVKKGGQFVSWANLKTQFGQEYGCSKDFKKKFKAALLKVRAVYPQARIDDSRVGGLTLYNSPPPIQSTKTYLNVLPLSERS